MPGGFPIAGGSANFKDQGSVTSGNSTGTTVTAHATLANNKGNWAIFTASTPNDASGFMLFVGYGAANVSYLIDIGFGATGSERVVVSNVPLGIANEANAGFEIFVPIAVPAGTQIQARCQCSTANDSCVVQAILMDGGFAENTSFSAPQTDGTYNSDTAHSRGLLIDPGATANTPNQTWTVLSASTKWDIAAFQLVFDNQTASSTSMSLVDIGVGSLGSEVAVVPNIPLGFGSVSPRLYGAAPPLIRKRIPADERIARAQVRSHSYRLPAMSWTLDSSGTQTADGTEDILASPTANATYVLFVDLHTMAAGDIVELRCYTKVLSSSTLRQVWKGTFDFYDASINPIVQSPMLPSDQQAKFTLKQVAGTNESYDWAIKRQ